jgi:hypothetical protein
MYRYRALASLWWRATGQDIDLRLLLAEPGKAMQLELRTTTPAGARAAERECRHWPALGVQPKRLGEQPFYAFPWPDWAGSLDAVARSRRPRKEVTELAFRRSGSGWWFGDWMVVMTTRQVADVLRPDLTLTLPEAGLPGAAGPDRRNAASQEAHMGRPENSHV